jgi:antitoxin ParD1/3/4
MNVSLTPELEELIESEVREGRYHDAGEFLSAAIQHYITTRDLAEAYQPGEIDEKLARGLQQIERGEGIDGDEAFRELREYAAERRRRST